MATLRAMRYSSHIKQFPHNLRSAGRTGEVRIAACVRKPLTVLNAVCAIGPPQQPPKATTPAATPEF